MTINFKKAIINFAWAYITVTILAYAVSYIVGIVLKLPPPAPGESIFDSPEFVKTVPYHLLINLLCWTFFSYLYFTKRQDTGIKEAVYLGAFWLVTAMIVDLVCFVLIKSPVSLTPHQFYVEYQPWISITYLLVFVSPFIAYGITRRRKKVVI